MFCTGKAALSVVWTVLSPWEREEVYFLKYRVFWSI